MANKRVEIMAGPHMPDFRRPVTDNGFGNSLPWFGRGPFDNYAYRNAAAFIDIYSLKAADFFHPYPQAQESGCQTASRITNMGLR